ncbi:MAG: hypothetical protein L0Z53_08180 [Acidobacteriales bacterium]|nr:hypothetical protein [Terriglobales bacterium]
MIGRDFHNNLLCSRGMSPVAATTDNTAYVSEIIDTANVAATEFVGLTGSIADADVTFTVLVEHGDVSSLSDAAAVPDADLLGTEASAAPLFSSDNKTFKIGYLGSKRYARVTVTPAANSGNIFLCGVWLQTGTRTGPKSTQIN